MVAYCSRSNDRSLTKILIENSNKSSSKCFHRFVNTSEWVDGLDIWSSSQISKKNDVSTRNFDFHDDIGLYLPRCEKVNSTQTISSKGTNKDLHLPERLKQLIKREEFTSLSDQTSEDDQIINIIQKHSTETSSNKARFPFRQVESNNSFRDNKSKQNSEPINREKFQYLIKEEICNLLRRETSNISSKRTFIRIPSVEIKHENTPSKSTPQPDSTLIMERYNKLQRILVPPSPSSPSINNKSIDNRQSPLTFQGVSTFGLTVTPLDFSSTKHLPNSSVEKTTQQETTNRPTTQPALLPSSINQHGEQQTIFLKRNIQTGLVAASGEFILFDNNPIEEQTQIIKRYPRFHRSLSRSTIHRTKNLQLLPHVAGKRIRANISNQRN